MIVVRIKTGLGGQLFQYATARRLAYVNQTRLFLDISSYNTNPTRSYMLDHFFIEADIAKLEQIDLFSIENGLNCASNQKFLRVKEKYHHFDRDILNLQGNIYLDGFWQSELYFKDIKKMLTQELLVKSQPNNDSKKITKFIQNTNSVSVHIRRGDHVSNSFVNRTHGLLDLDYYYRAIRHIQGCILNPHFYIFSDDPIWVKENFDICLPATIVDVNGVDSAYEDLRLISRCKHHIIANSTLSWWGAWLSESPSKLICGPRSWFVTSDIRSDDIMPTNWQKL